MGSKERHRPHRTFARWRRTAAKKSIWGKNPGSGGEDVGNTNQGKFRRNHEETLGVKIKSQWTGWEVNTLKRRKNLGSTRDEKAERRYESRPLKPKKVRKRKSKFNKRKVRGIVKRKNEEPDFKNDLPNRAHVRWEKACSSWTYPDSLAPEEERGTWHLKPKKRHQEPPVRNHWGSMKETRSSGISFAWVWGSFRRKTGKREGKKREKDSPRKRWITSDIFEEIDVDIAGNEHQITQKDLPNGRSLAGGKERNAGNERERFWKRIKRRLYKPRKVLSAK